MGKRSDFERISRDFYRTPEAVGCITSSAFLWGRGDIL
jgi:hypothetical protein